MGVKFPGKKHYVTLEWPLGNSRQIAPHPPPTKSYTVQKLDCKIKQTHTLNTNRVRLRVDKSGIGQTTMTCDSLESRENAWNQWRIQSWSQVFFSPKVTNSSGW